MTNKELQAILKDYPDDLSIFILDEENEGIRLETVEITDEGIFLDSIDWEEDMEEDEEDDCDCEKCSFERTPIRGA